MRHGRHDHLTVVFETDETSVEEMVDARRQQQPVLAVEPLLIGRVTPWLAVAGSQVLVTIHSSDAAGTLDRHHPLLEEALAATREDYRLPFRLLQARIRGDHMQLVLLPLQQSDRRRCSWFIGKSIAAHQGAGLYSQEVDQ